MISRVPFAIDLGAGVKVAAFRSTGEAGVELVSCPDCGRSPEALAADIRRLRGELENRLGGTALGAAVLTIPAGASPLGRRAARRAADLAEVAVESCCGESSAAFLHLAMEKELSDGAYLVYSLGPWGFEAAVVRLVDGDVAELAVSSDHLLDAGHLARRFATSIREYPQVQTSSAKLDPGQAHDREALERWVSAAENAKRTLLTDDAARLNLGSSEIVVQRDDLEAAITEPLERALELCRSALETARKRGGIEASDVTGVLLRGADAQFPAVRQGLEVLLGGSLPPVFTDTGDAAACGAARLAARSGVAVRDGDECVELRLRGPESTSLDAVSLSGELRLLDDVEAGPFILYVKDADGFVVCEMEVGAGAFVVPEVDLIEETANRFAYELLSAHRVPILVGELQVRQVTEELDIGDGTVTVRVLPHEIALRVGDRPTVPLWPEGTALPATATLKIEGPNSSEARLYEGLALIGVVELPADASELGAVCDANRTLTARVDGRRLPVQPPDTPTSIEPSDVETRLDDLVSVAGDADADRLRISWLESAGRLSLAYGDTQTAQQVVESLAVLLLRARPVVESSAPPAPVDPHPSKSRIVEAESDRGFEITLEGAE